jgi:serine protease Do
LAKSIMQQLKQHGKVVRGWLGVEIQEVTPDLAKSFGLPMPMGALVAGVENDGPAAKAGIHRGDIIVKFNGETVHDEHELPEMVAQTLIGKTVPVEVIRNGKHVTLDASIAELKEQQVASAENPGEAGASWGLQVRDLTPELAQQLGLQTAKGVVVTNVKQDSAAADANLQQGDVILEINHQKVASADEFATLAREAQKKNSQSLLLVQRGNATLYTVIHPAQG